MPKARHLSFQHRDHLWEGFVLDPCQPFEVFFASLFYFSVSQVAIMTQLLFMQEVHKKTGRVAGFVIGPPKIPSLSAGKDGAGRATKYDLWIIASTDLK
jgi:hypothetical protein